MRDAIGESVDTISVYNKDNDRRKRINGLFPPSRSTRLRCSSGVVLRCDLGLRPSIIAIRKELGRSSDSRPLRRRDPAGDLAPSTASQLHCAGPSAAASVSSLCGLIKSSINDGTFASLNGKTGLAKREHSHDLTLPWQDLRCPTS